MRTAICVCEMQGSGRSVLLREIATTVFDDALFMNSCSAFQATPLAQAVRTVHINPCEVLDSVSIPRCITELGCPFP
jgi:hypothetical protein